MARFPIYYSFSFIYKYIISFLSSNFQVFLKIFSNLLEALLRRLLKGIAFICLEGCDFGDYSPINISVPPFAGPELYGPSH